jgi:hypothetical protein
MHDKDVNNFWLLNTSCTTDDANEVQCSEYEGLHVRTVFRLPVWNTCTCVPILHVTY